MKKKFLTFILSICFIIPCIFMLSACSTASANIEFKVENGYIQYYDGENWNNLIAVEDLKGVNGIGIDGREVEFRNTTTLIQWRYVNASQGADENWINLIVLDDIKGKDLTKETITISIDTRIDSSIDNYESLQSYFDNYLINEGWKKGPYETLYYKTISKGDCLHELSDMIPETIRKYFCGWYVGDDFNETKITSYMSITTVMNLEARWKSNFNIINDVVYEYDEQKDAFVCTGAINDSIENLEILNTCKKFGTTAYAPVYKIDSFAFNSKINLKNVKIPANVLEIGINPFVNCNNLQTIIVDSENENFDSRNNCNAVIKTKENEIIIGCKNTIIPSNVLSIGRATFYGCLIAYITIPESVTNIDYQAFYNAGLTQIHIPESIVLDYSYDLFHCSDLKEVTIDSSSVANSLVSLDGDTEKLGLLNYANKVYVKSGLVVNDSTYLTGKFSKLETSDKSGYDMYVRNA